MRIWLIAEGRYYEDRTIVVECHTTKSGAERATRAAGFKYSVDEGFFCNDTSKYYRKIRAIQLQKQ